MTDITDVMSPGEPEPEESGGFAGSELARNVAPALSSSLARGWLRYRAWRQSRPFSAGVWLILSGAELLLIPLPVRDMGFILHIGIGGLSGLLIGAVLILLGLLLWFIPAQRVLYSILAVLLAVGALIATNLGGFLIGTLFGMIGGSLGFGWSPGRTESDSLTTDVSGGEGPPSADSDFASGEESAAPDEESTAPDASEQDGTAANDDADDDWAIIPGLADQDATPVSERGTAGGHITREFVLLPVAVGMLGLAHLTAAPAADPSASATPTATASASPTATASASPTATASASPTATASAAPTATASASPTDTASPTAAPSPVTSTPASTPVPTGPATTATGSTTAPQSTVSADPSSSASATPSPTASGSAPPLTAATELSSLTAPSASIASLAYDGVVSFATGSGSQQMVEFTATSMDLTGAQFATSGSSTLTVTASLLHYDGAVVLYTTQLSADLNGTSVTITPTTPAATAQQLLGQAGTTQPTPLTNVTTQEAVVLANTLTATSLEIS